MRRVLLLTTVAALMACLCATALAADDQAVLLRYKFAPDQEITQSIKGTGTIPMVIDLPEGQGEQAGGQQTIETAIEMDMEMVQKCDKVLEDGAGHLTMTVPVMINETTTKIGEKSTFSVMSWEDGEFVLTADGKQVDAPQVEQMMSAFANGYKVTMKPNGEVKMDEETQDELSGLLKLSGLGGVDFTKLSAVSSRLPDAPVKPGDTWKNELKVPVGEAEIALATEMKYVGMEEVNKVPCARLEGKVSMSTTGELPAGKQAATPVEMKIEAMAIDMDVVSFFDPAAGFVRKSTIEMTQNMDITIKAPAGPNNAVTDLPAVIEDGKMHIEVEAQ